MNGSVRPLFPQASFYVGIDLDAGPGVDVVDDAADYGDASMAGRFDAIVSSECLEHCQRAADLCQNAARLLKPGGIFIVTCASELRAPHGRDGNAVPEGQFYRRVTTQMLYDWLAEAGFGLILFSAEMPPEDIHCLAITKAEAFG